MTISSDDLVRRNAAFAASGAFAGLPFPTSDTLQVLGCVDSRVDPSDVLGLELGYGVVMRNIGGRITPATLRSWALLGRLSRGQPPRSGHLVILHHTDCGITRLTDYPEQLAAFFEIPADELESKAIADPYAAVRVDTAIARHTLSPGPARVWPGLRRQHRAHRDRRPGHPGVAGLCKESATADDVQAAMPHPVVGSAAIRPRRGCGRARSPSGPARLGRYPIARTDVISEELHVGTVPMFTEAGFRQVSAPTPRRLVMRIDFQQPARGG